MNIRNAILYQNSLLSCNSRGYALREKYLNRTDPEISQDGGIFGHMEELNFKHLSRFPGD